MPRLAAQKGGHPAVRLSLSEYAIRFSAHSAPATTVVGVLQAGTAAMLVKTALSTSDAIHAEGAVPSGSSAFRTELPPANAGSFSVWPVIQEPSVKMD